MTTKYLYTKLHQAVIAYNEAETPDENGAVSATYLFTAGHPDGRVYSPLVVAGFYPRALPNPWVRAATQAEIAAISSGGYNAM
jgi:hypothetical protein